MGDFVNIKSIKAEVHLLVKEEKDKSEVINAVVDILSDLLYTEGKIADVLIVHGKRRFNKNKKTVK